VFLRKMTMGQRFAAWVLLSLVLATLWGVSPMPEFLYSHFPSPPRPFYGAGILIAFAFVLAVLMGLIRADAPVVLLGVIGFSIFLPAIIIFLDLTVGCFVTVALGIRGYCL
jgi:hypothetical protein